MKNYDEIELEIGINCGEPVSDSDSWIKFTQSMRRNAIADTELAMFRKAHPAKLPKLQSKPINATDYITSNVLTLRDNLARVIELYHETTAGVQTYFTERNKAWDKLDDRQYKDFRKNQRLSYFDFDNAKAYRYYKFDFSGGLKAALNEIALLYRE